MKDENELYKRSQLANLSPNLKRHSNEFLTLIFFMTSVLPTPWYFFLKKILNHTYMKILNTELLTNQRLLLKLVILHKKTRTLLIVLYYLIQYLRYASYCIALEMEEINYLYLYLYLYLECIVQSPLLPTVIGVWYSQTISNLCEAEAAI